VTGQDKAEQQQQQEKVAFAISYIHSVLQRNESLQKKLNNSLKITIINKQTDSWVLTSARLSKLGKINLSTED